MVIFNNYKIADEGYYINLDHRVDRRQKIEEQFERFKIEGINRFSAIKSETGPEGCKKSHYEIYEKFLRSNGEILLILEDDCLFLDFLIDESKIIFDDIFETKWDLFWLGCRNRRWPILFENKCYTVSSVSHTQSYLIKRSMVEYILNEYPVNQYGHLSIDELLCLIPYGKEVAYNPNKFGFYQMEQPLDNLRVEFTSLCYEKSLTTQYPSYSDLWKTDTDIANYIITSFPIYKNG
jgi:GR25 family glycosyltransferase involved in LPS biosynthesis